MVNHDLIATIAIALAAAFVGGLVARRVGLPPIVGYLLAGVAIGPFTPGIIAESEIATELAEVGVILLMFGVGIHFSFRDLMAVKNIAVPGAIGQVTIATFFGVLLGIALGWGPVGGLALGLSVSVASTVVLLRELIIRNSLETPQGRAAVGWLIVEDILTIVVLVVLPSVAGLLGGHATVSENGAGPIGEALLAVGKAILLGVLVVVLGTRLVPWVLMVVTRLRSRELFTLAVLAIALGIAYASFAIFGVSLALGAFLAGAAVGESELSHQAAADATPFRDAFSVIFFVSVGMLVDPSYLLGHIPAILAVLVLIVVIKASAAFLVVAALRHPLRTGLTVAAGLSQVGEFSFILATMAVSLGLLPHEGLQLVVAGAVFSITLNPFMFNLIEPAERWLRMHPGVMRYLRTSPEPPPPDVIETVVARPGAHVIMCGHGRVGGVVRGALERRGFDTIVIDQDRGVVEALRERGVHALLGDATSPEILTHAGIASARMVIIAMADMATARVIVEVVQKMNPRVQLIVRTHSEKEAAFLTSQGKVQGIFAERELAVQMARYALRGFGVSGVEAEQVAQGLRRVPMTREQPRPAAGPSISARIRHRVQRWLGRPVDEATD